MTDEEIIRELKSVEERYRNKPVPTFEVNTSSMARSCRQHIEQLAKENAELKKEISVLLSCSDCSENKGGYVCEKEYNDKCLAQKIEYIKELNEEIAELKEQIESLAKINIKAQTIIAELKAQIEELKKDKEYLDKINNEQTEVILQLQQQIEKMKCCGNCKWYRVENGGEIFCDCVGDCINFDKWEMRNVK